MCCSVRALKVILLLCTSTIIVLTIVVNYFTTAGVEVARTIGLLETYNTSQIWSQRTIVQNGSTFLPTGWTFSVWFVIYAYQVVWLIYCWTTVFRRLYPDGEFLCCDPDLAPCGLLVWHFLSSLCNMAWILLADRVDFNRTLLIPQTCVLAAIALCLYCSLVSSYWSLARGKELLASYRRADFYLTIALVQNGVSLYAGWVTFATFLNIDVLLIFLTPVQSDLSSFICLCTLSGLIAAYVVADLTVLDPLTRFVVTPHLIVAWACAGSLVKNFEAWSINTIITLALVGIVGVGLLLKLIAACVRAKTSPLLKQRVYHLKRDA